VVADRRIPEFAPEHEPQREGLRPDPHANQNAPSIEPLAKAGSAKSSFLQQLLREAALAIRAGEARAAELQQELDQMAALGQEMAETIRSERARAEAAEERARAAAEHAKGVEQRAQTTIRNLVQRADATEGRLHAALCWIEEVRSVVAAGPVLTNS
jgi:methyl-accepting chemotaxis protein